MTLRSIRPIRSLYLFLLLTLAAVSCARAATLQQAADLLHSGQFAQADRAIAQVLAAQPDSAAAHYLDARLLAAEGKWPLAEKELERARQIDPALAFAPADQAQALTNDILRHRWKNPAGLAGYGQAALAVLFLGVSAYLVWGILRGRRRTPRA
ncbi:MAG: tetratricopeptide repeat protein [Thiomonas sp.]